MRCVVIGAGAWGLPAAAELASRKHEVTLIDRYGVGNALSSSRGPSRLWRLGDPDRSRVRLSRRGLAAMERLAERSEKTIFLRNGLLWRDPHSHGALLSSLEAEGIEFQEIRANDVGSAFPGLQPDGRDAVLLADAGVVLAENALRAQFDLFTKAEGSYLPAVRVTEITETPNGLRVSSSDGVDRDAEIVVVAAGPGTRDLLPSLGIAVPLHSYLEQVVHFGDPANTHATDDLPCFFDGPIDQRRGIYGMPTPGVGYKIGLDFPLGDYDPDSDDRTPDESRTETIRQRVEEDLRSISASVIDAQVCSWTDSPDGQFVIDSLGNGVILACGDSGEGFKYSALMGEVLADLAEGVTPDRDIAACGLHRFSGRDIPEKTEPTRLGNLGH